VELAFTVDVGNTEVAGLEVERLVLGHFQPVWGLAAHPTQPKFLTCGYDGNVIYWDAVAHTDLWVVQLNGKAHCVDISPDGLAYAVGTLGGVLHVGSMEIKQHAVQSLGQPVRTVAFSPSRNLLAAASDSVVTVFQFGPGGYDEPSKVAECRGHGGPVEFMDWSTDGRHLRSNAPAELELRHWDSDTGSAVEDRDLLGELTWATTRCPLSWAALATSQAAPPITSCDATQQLLAVGEAGGKVKLFTAPASQPAAHSLELVAHGSQATAVRFLEDPVQLVSVGGRETSIIQWNLETLNS